MSRENVEVVRRARRAFNERDFDRALADCDPQIIWRYPDPFSGLSRLSGRADVKAFWEKLAHGWVGFEVLEDEVVEEGAESVVIAARYRARGRDTGVEVEMRLFEVYCFRDGKMLSVEMFTDRDEALEAVELSE